MIARDALVLTATKRVQVFSVQTIDDGGDILSLVINGAHDLARLRDSRDLQLRRGNHETFVNKDIRVLGMIDDHESQVIVIISLPKLGSDPQIVVTVMRYELIAA